MHNNHLAPDELLKEILYLSLDEQDIELRLRKLEELLQELSQDDYEENP